MGKYPALDSDSDTADSEDVLKGTLQSRVMRNDSPNYLHFFILGGFIVACANISHNLSHHVSSFTLFCDNVLAHICKIFIVELLKNVYLVTVYAFKQL